jgi:phospholipid transport system substrate-binding protein
MLAAKLADRNGARRLRVGGCFGRSARLLFGAPRDAREGFVGRSRRVNLLLLMTALLAGLLCSGMPRAEQDPAAVVNMLHDALLGVMRGADRLGVQGRYDLLKPTLETAYDFPTMIRIAAGSFWVNASDSERDDLLSAFSRLSIATYASRFSGYSGESFETLGERPGPRGTILVDTRLVRPDEEPVPLTYVLQRSGETWKIVDVIVEGAISELAVRRSEYSQILRQGGPDRLASVLNAKAEKMLQPEP